LVGFDEDDGWIVMILMFVTHVRGDAIFLCIPASVFFCPFSSFGLEHTFGYFFWLYFSCFLCGIAYVGAFFGFRFDAVRY
jgi:hypothetical protein